jgi:hypothetical protein
MREGVRERAREWCMFFIWGKIYTRDVYNTYNNVDDIKVSRSAPAACQINANQPARHRWKYNYRFHITRTHILGNKCMGISPLAAIWREFIWRTHSLTHARRLKSREGVTRRALRRPRRQTTNWLPLRELYLKAEQIKISSNQMYRLSLRFIRKRHSFAHDSAEWDGAVVSTLSVLKSTQGKEQWPMTVIF